MTQWHEDVPRGAVVHLVASLGDGGTPRPPSHLRLRVRPTPGVRRVGVAVASLAGAACVGLCALLWLSETPGWWFDAIFTVFLLGTGLGCVVATVAWHDDATAETAASAAWAGAPGSGPSTGRVVDRSVRLGSESGRVVGFALRVETPSGAVVAGWHDVDDDGLLQSQVPGVGSPVRVWTSTAGPVVVEAADPSVVPPDDAVP